ncbi:MAG: SGNH/GDSL hydrolase family protein, partial [Planctomycetes bacterium]|nr:SGNH/GDSL hydrolase family protein [Planctomycetota bacterium]
TVVRPKENCAGTTKGIQKIDQWLKLDGGNFDIIHFNFGLHDLKRVKESGRNSNDPCDPPQADIEAYEKNLRHIVSRLKSTGASLIFATTTPVPAGVKPHRDPDDPPRYNAVAKKVMKENDIVINDLYGGALERIADLQQPANVHFNAKGSQWLARHVTQHIRTAIRRRNAD